MDSVIRQFILDLRSMIALEGTEYPAPWCQVPEKYVEDFKSWCGEVKQQSWDGMWERGWANYALEYLVFVIDRFMEEN